MVKYVTWANWPRFFRDNRDRNVALGCSGCFEESSVCWKIQELAENPARSWTILARDKVARLSSTSFWVACGNAFAAASFTVDDDTIQRGRPRTYVAVSLSLESRQSASDYFRVLSRQPDPFVHFQCLASARFILSCPDVLARKTQPRNITGRVPPMAHNKWRVEYRMEAAAFVPLIGQLLSSPGPADQVAHLSWRK